MSNPFAALLDNVFPGVPEVRPAAPDASIERVRALIENPPFAQPKVANGAAFTEVAVDLSVSTGATLNTPGYGIVYRRQGSTPTGRLDIGSFRELYPGARIKGAFDQLKINRSSSSGVIGTARLVILATPNADFIEPDLSLSAVPGQAFVPSQIAASVNLTSITTAALAFVANPNFTVTGWRTVRVNLTSAGTSVAYPIQLWTTGTVLADFKLVSQQTVDARVPASCSFDTSGLVGTCCFVANLTGVVGTSHLIATVDGVL